MAQIAVIGCGHVGLVMAAGLALDGHDVIGVDKDPGLVAELIESRIHINEDGLSTLVEDGLANGNLTFTTEYALAIPRAEFIFLCVDTPQTLLGAADMRSLRAAVAEIGNHLGANNPIIVNKSTSPIGTGETIETLLIENLASRGHVPTFVSNPEFLRQGHAVEDYMRPSRIVVGAHQPQVAQAVVDLYGNVDCPVSIVSIRTAELIKYVANAFLATRVSFINEIARLCDALAVDVDDVVAGIALDPRIGDAMFKPGIGYGGSCLPKDVAALRYVAERYATPTPLLNAVQEVNAAARLGIVRLLHRRLGRLDGLKLAVWGLTFKGGTEDLRDSPAMDVVRMLVNEGAVVVAFDPSLNALNAVDGVATAADALNAVEGVAALVVLTDWPEFRKIPMTAVRSAMASTGTLVVDGRNVLDPHAVRGVGLDYVGVGRGASR